MRLTSMRAFAFGSFFVAAALAACAPMRDDDPLPATPSSPAPAVGQWSPSTAPNAEPPLTAAPISTPPQAPPLPQWQIPTAWPFPMPAPQQQPTPRQPQRPAPQQPAPAWPTTWTLPSAWPSAWPVPQQPPQTPQQRPPAQPQQPPRASAPSWPTLPGFPALPGAPASNDAAQRCVDRINGYRATKGLGPLKRWADGESCANSQSKDDGASGQAHGTFGRCKEHSQNACPGWPQPAESAIDGCLQMMWNEGPGSFPEHGHYENMVDKKVTEVACGFATMSNGKLWSVQDFR
ncbi:MAG TPA: CAP domain-containing protein [Byssovorax sp.]|jgi:hypothetical protein